MDGVEYDVFWVITKNHAKVQQKMNICNKIARKFTFECDFVTNGLH